MRRLCCGILCLVLLVSFVLPFPVGAIVSLERRVLAFMQEKGLNEENFALSYFNLVSGESFDYNETALFPAGDLWMLPLHMYYCEQESLGTFDPPAERPDEEFLIDGLTLAECRYQSLILGKKEIAVSMQELMGGHSSFKVMVNEAFGHCDQESLTDAFLTENGFSTQFWIHTICALSEQPELYLDLTQNYKMIQTADGLAGFSRSYQLFHLRAEEDGVLTAVGKVWGPQTFAVACCVSAQQEGDTILAQINDLICAYLEELTSASPNETASTQSTAVAEKDLTVSTVTVDHSRGMARWVGIALAAAAVVAIVIAVFVWLIRRRRDDIYYD